MGLTFEQWAKLFEISWMVALSILAFGKFMQRADKPQTEQQGTQDHVDSVTLITAIDKRLVAVEARMDRAGNQTSDLATTVQGLETKMRAIFPDKGVCASQMHESESDRRQLRDQIAQIWQHVNRGRS